jgi:hypothetical protein
MHASVEADRAKYQREEYPATLAIPTVPTPARKFFKFEYIPRQSGNGHIEGYVIQATQICRDNGPPRTFSIFEDGGVYYTNEPRAATRSDSRLE